VTYVDDVTVGRHAGRVHLQSNFAVAGREHDAILFGSGAFRRTAIRVFLPIGGKSHKHIFISEVPEAKPR
jgi:hypothetical protein